jgi:AraC family transcriptional regulator
MPNAPEPPPHILSRVLASERLLFSSSLVCLGTFRTAPGDPSFHGGEPCSGHSVVFPRRAIWIQVEGRRRRVVDPTLVALYNRGQIYRRDAIDPLGDACEWMAFPSPVLVDALAAIGHRAQDRPEAPFEAPDVPVSGELYAAQRRLFVAAGAACGAPDPRTAGEIEERALTLLDLVLRRHLPDRERRRTPLESIEEARRLICLERDAPLPLAVLAGRCGVTPYRLCREFRQVTGMTITEYRTRLRLCRALGRLPRTDDLSALALSAGFCSHSHFGAAFRRVFKTTPSRMREELRANG